MLIVACDVIIDDPKYSCLQARGIAAHALDLTLPHGMTGCYGHPSHDDHVEIAAKAKGNLAAVLGWD